MRLMKMFGLAAIAAVAATAFLGASSASALDTQLCKVNTALLCPSGQAVTEVHLVNSGVIKLLNDLVDVLCLNALKVETPLALGKPQLVHVLSASFASCGTSVNHNECTFTVEELPLLHLLKLADNFGLLLSLNGILRIKCTVFGFIKLDCEYDMTGLESEVTGGEPAVSTLEETPIEVVEGGGLCPEETRVDGVLLSLGPAYIKS